MVQDVLDRVRLDVGVIDIKVHYDDQIDASRLGIFLAEFAAEAKRSDVLHGANLEIVRFEQGSLWLQLVARVAAVGTAVGKGEKPVTTLAGAAAVLTFLGGVYLQLVPNDDRKPTKLAEAACSLAYGEGVDRIEISGTGGNCFAINRQIANEIRKAEIRRIAREKQLGEQAGRTAHLNPSDATLLSIIEKAVDESPDLKKMIKEKIMNEAQGPISSSGD